MSYVDDVLARVIAKNPSEPEFHQAVTEVFESLRPVIEANEEFYKKEAILERLIARATTSTQTISASVMGSKE